jgi:glycosyltransferase involved in cell wall biosynthesis
VPQSEVSDVGVVVIGRNEGERLCRCFDSLMDQVQAIVYVDSGSTDDSIANATSRGVHVINLDTSVPFTAARARNAGFEKLQELFPEIRFVQFVDGDVEVCEGWIQSARTTLDYEDKLAVVCGHLLEKHPDKTIYNKLCSLEWKATPGEALSCGGNSMMRAKALTEAHGFNAKLIAGEEPELCLRMRHDKWRILRADVNMARHDANILSFSQWWRRSTRSGHAFAEGYWLHRDSADHYRRSELRSILLWGVLFPIAIIAALPLTTVVSGAGLITYLALYFRIRANRIIFGDSQADAGLYARFCVLAKFPQALGTLQFFVLNVLLGTRRKLIEHK